MSHKGLMQAGGVFRCPRGPSCSSCFHSVELPSFYGKLPTCTIFPAHFVFLKIPEYPAWIFSMDIQSTNKINSQMNVPSPISSSPQIK